MRTRTLVGLSGKILGDCAIPYAVPEITLVTLYLICSFLYYRECLLSPGVLLCCYRLWCYDIAFMDVLTASVETNTKDTMGSIRRKLKGIQDGVVQVARMFGL